MFDDIGCLLDAVRRERPGGDAHYWFHDADDGGWIDGAEAVFCRVAGDSDADGRRLVAYRDPSAAERAAGRRQAASSDRSAALLRRRGDRDDAHARFAGHAALAAAALIACGSHAAALDDDDGGAAVSGKGLQLYAYGTGMTGDVPELNILNHYIGMPPIEAPALETALFPLASRCWWCCACSPAAPAGFAARGDRGGGRRRS